MHVLVADREREALNLIRLSLSSDGHTVDTCVAGEEALKKASKRNYDVIVLAVTLPGLSGVEVAATIRKAGDPTPIMMISNASQEDDIIHSFEAGADCYAIKPLSPEEVLVRVRALFRRGEMAKSATLTFQDLRLSQSDHTVVRGETSINLTGTEFKLLAVLMRSPNQAVSREDLLKKVWNSKTPSDTRILDAHMANLRKKLQNSGPALIETVHRHGYRLG